MLGCDELHALEEMVGYKNERKSSRRKGRLQMLHDTMKGRDDRALKRAAAKNRNA